MHDSPGTLRYLKTGKPAAIVVFWLLLLCLLAVEPAQATRIVRKPTRGVVGFKIGVVSGTNVGGAFDFQTDASWAGEVFADIPLGRSKFVGLAFDFYKVRLVNDQQVMLNANITFKHLIRLKKAGMDLKPGFALGYAHLAQINVIDPTDYTTFRLFFETAFDYGRSRAWLAEVGVFWTLSGGNDEYDVSIGPAFMLRFGVQFR